MMEHQRDIMHVCMQKGPDLVADPAGAEEEQLYVCRSGVRQCLIVNNPVSLQCPIVRQLMSDIVGSRQSDEPTIRHSTQSSTVISVPVRHESDSFVRQFRQCPTIRAQVATSRDADVLRWCVASRRPAMVCDGPRWSAIVRARAASPRISRDIPRYSAIFRDMLRWCDVL